MCGLVGAVGSAEDTRTLDLPEALRSLRHRGPDSCGLFRDESQSWSCVLGHTRLAIIDPSSSASQPMTSADGRFTLIYNGEIYNFESLRQILGGLGFRFQSASDTEVLLAAYEAWGSDCLSRLRGMFAFAVWDRVERKLFLARDRFGIKPLYVSRRGAAVMFASEMRVLMRSPFVEPRLSLGGLISYLTFGCVSEPFSLTAGIEPLPPGTWLEVSATGEKMGTYWRLDPTNDSAPADVSTVLREVVECHLVSDVPLAIFLSGGIDSASLVALASRNRAASVHTFTVAFPEAAYSEERFAAEVARLFGSDHHQVTVTGREVSEHFGAFLESMDQPSADGLNTYLVCKAARQAGITVALSGLGADEIFAGYPQFAHYRTIQQFGRGVSRFVGPFSHSGTIPFRWRRAIARVANAGHPRRLYRVLREFFDPLLQSQLLNRELAGMAAAYSDIDFVDSRGIPSVNAFEEFSRFELANFLKNMLLRDADIMSMANSVEIRVPYLDHVLVETVLSASRQGMTNFHTNKALLVRSVPELPSVVTRRKKMGFTMPLDEWLRTIAKDQFENTFLGYALDCPMFDERAVRKAWDAFQARRPGFNAARMVSLVAFGYWCSRYGVTDIDNDLGASN